MAQRRFHYDQAFEIYLRQQAIPYVAVDEAKRALAPRKLCSGDGPSPGAEVSSLKSFDFVVYGQSGVNLLVDVKGRKHTGPGNRGLQNWVTRDDVESLRMWEGIFGAGFMAVFAFLYWCDAAPPASLFMDYFESSKRWYAVLAVRLSDYQAAMRHRSERWQTVSLPAAEFARLAVPLKDLL
ncbi:MAG: HYExAFE family protein [Phycisphaeraceae bacterium]|nr:HYExAFE family protein [Phycisphaeraceae bacterium]